MSEINSQQFYTGPKGDNYVISHIYQNSTELLNDLKLRENSPNPVGSMVMVSYGGIVGSKIYDGNKDKDEAYGNLNSSIFQKLLLTETEIAEYEEKGQLVITEAATVESNTYWCYVFQVSSLGEPNTGLKFIDTFSATIEDKGLEDTDTSTQITNKDYYDALKASNSLPKTVEDDLEINSVIIGNFTCLKQSDKKDEKIYLSVYFIRNDEPRYVTDTTTNTVIENDIAKMYELSIFSGSYSPPRNIESIDGFAYDLNKNNLVLGKMANILSNVQNIEGQGKIMIGEGLNLDNAPSGAIALGKNNLNIGGSSIFVIGNGTDENNRNNLFEIQDNGDGNYRILLNGEEIHNSTYSYQKLSEDIEILKAKNIFHPEKFGANGATNGVYIGNDTWRFLKEDGNVFDTAPSVKVRFHFIDESKATIKDFKINNETPTKEINENYLDKDLSVNIKHKIEGNYEYTKDGKTITIKISEEFYLSDFPKTDIEETVIDENEQSRTIKTPIYNIPVIPFDFGIYEDEEGNIRNTWDLIFAICDTEELKPFLPSVWHPGNYRYFLDGDTECEIYFVIADLNADYICTDEKYLQMEDGVSKLDSFTITESGGMVFDKNAVNPIVDKDDISKIKNSSKAALTLYPSRSGGFDKYFPNNSLNNFGSYFTYDYNGSYAKMPPFQYRDLAVFYFRGPKLFDFRSASDRTNSKGELIYQPNVRQGDCGLTEFSTHIKPVYKATGGSRTDISLSNVDLEYSVHKYFLPSLIEDLGETNFLVQQKSYYFPNKTEGTKYSFGSQKVLKGSVFNYSDSHLERFMYRSPDMSNNKLWLSKTIDEIVEGCGQGYPKDNSYYDITIGVIPFFCI